VFIYIELSQIHKSIFKLNINSNGHIVQDERKQISCEPPLAWRRLDAGMQLGCSFALDAALPPEISVYITKVTELWNRIKNSYIDHSHKRL
jgi:hypothetical protein